MVQLSLFGEIDPDIYFEFNPLWQLDDAGLAAVQKTKADIHAVYLESGVVSPEEVREAVAQDEQSPYHGLDLSGPAPGPVEVPGDPGEGADPDDAEVDRGR